MDSLNDELKIEIFKYINTPLSLLLTNRKWYTISQNSYARANWVIYKYGRTHVLFHAVKLGNNFLSMNVAQTLLNKGAIISRYFIQRLALQFGAPDQQLINIQAQYDGKYGNSRPSWASELHLQVFAYLLTEAKVALNLKDNELPLKGNDMELFHYLTGGPFEIDLVSQILYENLESIKHLILNNKFIPFPPRPKPIPIPDIDITSVSSVHLPSFPSVPFITFSPAAPFISLPSSAPSIPTISSDPSVSYMSSINHIIFALDYQDGYETNQQLNLIARAIIICPDLITMWKQIGYDEICIHYNDLVLRGAILILFPPIKPANWTYPEPHEVVKRISQFTDLGFQLTDSVIMESVKLFENKLQEIQILLNSFYIIQGEAMRPIIDSCFNPAIMAAKKKKKRKSKK